MSINLITLFPQYILPLNLNLTTLYPNLKSCCIELNTIFIWSFTGNLRTRMTIWFFIPTICKRIWNNYGILFKSTKNMQRSILIWRRNIDKKYTSNILIISSTMLREKAYKIYNKKLISLWTTITRNYIKQTHNSTY